MSYDFPNAPTEGQKFTPGGGPRYIFASGVWKFDSVYIGESIPEAPVDGTTYGRKNEAWDRVLSLNGDVLDGGNF